jgi:hypothetical protein
MHARSNPNIATTSRVRRRSTCERAMQLLENEITSEVLATSSFQKATSMLVQRTISPHGRSLVLLLREHLERARALEERRRALDFLFPAIARHGAGPPRRWSLDERAWSLAQQTVTSASRRCSLARRTTSRTRSSCARALAIVRGHSSDTSDSRTRLFSRAVTMGRAREAAFSPSPIFGHVRTFSDTAFSRAATMGRAREAAFSPSPIFGHAGHSIFSDRNRGRPSGACSPHRTARRFVAQLARARRWSSRCSSGHRPSQRSPARAIPREPYSRARRTRPRPRWRKGGSS